MTGIPENIERAEEGVDVPGDCTVPWLKKKGQFWITGGGLDILAS